MTITSQVKFLVKFLVSAGLLFVLLTLADWTAILEALTAADWRLVFAAFLLFYVHYYIGSRCKKASNTCRS